MELDQQSEGLPSTAQNDDDEEESIDESTSSHNNDYNDHNDSDNRCNISDNANMFRDFDNEEIIQEENLEHNNLGRKMLYEGCNITKEESELLLMSYAMRFWTLRCCPPISHKCNRLSSSKTRT